MNVSGIMNTGLSGMRTQANRANAVANNLANINTPGYQRIDPNTLTAEEGQSVDSASELTTLIEAEQGFKANAIVFETGADLWELLAGIKRD